MNMAQSVLETRKKILEDLKRRADSLVSEILVEADINEEKVDPSSFKALDEIIKRVENMKFDGNIELLRETVAVYQIAINKIDEQLQPENIQGYTKESIDSLKEAKKFIEGQSKDGRVGTIFSKVEELAEKELSGEMEKEYNDEQIKEFNYAIKDQKEKEEKREEPFNKIKSATRKNREKLADIQAIISDIDSLMKEKQELEKELKEPEADKETIKEDIKEVEEEIKAIASKAKENEKDKTYSLNENEKMEDYIKRIKSELEKRRVTSENAIKNDLKGIENLEVDLGTSKQKVKEYLKEYIAKGEKAYNLTDKLTTDKQILKRHIEKQEDHKEMQELEDKKRVYEERNEDVYMRMEEYEENQQQQMQVYENTGWFGRFKNFIKTKFHIGNRQARDTGYNDLEEDAAIKKETLKAVEKATRNRGKGFKERYTVEEKEKISAEATTSLNNRREKYYQYLEEEARKEEEQGRG